MLKQWYVIAFCYYSLWYVFSIIVGSSSLIFQRVHSTTMMLLLGSLDVGCRGRYENFGPSQPSVREIAEQQCEWEFVQDGAEQMMCEARCC